MDHVTRRGFLGVAAGGLMAGAAAWRARAVDAAADRPNVLLITADDMGDNAPGCFGGRVPDITPNIDRLASEGMRFTRAHVTCAVCMPSRETLMTGRYPHNHGGQGFNPIRTDVPTLQECLRGAGYRNGILAKVEHLQPPQKFPWDFERGWIELLAGRDPRLYAEAAAAFFTQCAAEGRPFCLMANSCDPHRPFHGSADEAPMRKPDGSTYYPPPSRVYRPEEIEVPGFLPDRPKIREELAQYYSSCRRCDDTVGAVLRALEESDQAENTLVMFLSDNGMAFPFAKTNCYLRSTRTPWIVRWPGRVAPRSTEDRHFISGIDFMPTVLEALGVPAPEGMDGRSFLPLLRGETQPGRERVYTVFHATSAKNEYPMRGVQDQRFGYIFNAWSDGRREFKNESQSGLTMNAMREAAESDAQVAERVKHFLYRAPEELYDLQSDPDALVNLASREDHREDLRRKRAELLRWMEQTGDPLLPEFRRLV